MEYTLKLNEEEKKAIDWLKKAEFFSARLYAPIILNLLEKQQKEIKKYKNVISNLNNNWISKEEIRERIGYYKQDYKRQDKEGLFNLTLITTGKLSALQELLGE